jgi:hypothetical protein
VSTPLTRSSGRPMSSEGQQPDFVFWFLELIALGCVLVAVEERFANEEIRSGVQWLIAGLIVGGVGFTWRQLWKMFAGIPRLRIIVVPTQQSTARKVVEEGRRIEKAPGTLTPIRVLERHYMALATLRKHVDILNKQKEVGGTISASAFIDLDLALKKMRKELVDLSPQVFTTSEALDFRETVWSDPETLALSDDRVPKEIDHLMATILDHWRRRGEAVGITPLKYKAATIVKLEDE